MIRISKTEIHPISLGYPTQRGKAPTPQKKGVSWIWHLTVSDGEAPVMEIWGVCSIPSLPLLPGSLWLGVVEPVWAPSMDQKYSKKHVMYLIAGQIIDIKYNKCMKHFRKDCTIQKWSNLVLCMNRSMQNKKCVILFTQPLRSGRIWYKVNF